MRKAEEFIEMVVQGASPAAVVSEMLVAEARTRAGQLVKEKNVLAKEFAKDVRRAGRITTPYGRRR